MGESRMAEVTISLKELDTKLANQKTELTGTINSQKTALEGQISTQRTEINQALASQKQDLEAKIQNLNLGTTGRLVIPVGTDKYATQ
jgi:ATP/maltotriose-dependent transcriptional regulator MalT